MAVIRTLASAGAYSFSRHAFEERMLERGFDLEDVLKIMAQGDIDGPIIAGRREGEWKCTVIGKLPWTSREAGVVTVVVRERRLIFVSGMDGSTTARYAFALKGRRHLPKPYHFKGSGLPNVYLLSGVKIERDAEYGELVTIDRLPELFMAIAFRLVSKPDRLTGPEMRFLRKRMEMTQTGLAKELWVSEQTVANYEKGNTEAGPADRALRLLFLAHVAGDDDVADDLRLEAEDLLRPARRGRRAPKAGPWSFASRHG